MAFEVLAAILVTPDGAFDCYYKFDLAQVIAGLQM